MDRKYAVILGNLGNTKDRFCGSYKESPSTEEMLQRAAEIPHVSGIELVGTWDISPDNADQMKRALDDLDLTCVSIIPDLFGNSLYWKGAYTSANAEVRRHAIDYTKQMCEIARQLDCEIVNLWPGQDGYDYNLTADYAAQRAWMCEAVAELAESYPDLRFALEYKPKEPRTHSTLARMADTLLLAQETGHSNVGVTIDTGHAFVGGETVSESIVLARRAGDRLFHMHFNDNHGTWDDDMIVGSVHTVRYLEILYWLDRTEYDGWFSMDQYPYREDAAGAIGESILWLRRFDHILQTHRSGLDELVGKDDAVKTSRFLRETLLSV
ncbi:MAG: sugar phosphate isomerase/epimerase family protein [Anaerolineae bacterium]